MTQFRFDRSFQLSILKLMLKECIFTHKATKYIKSSYFEDEYLSWFFMNTVKHYNNYAVLPDVTTFINDIQNKIDPSKQSIYHTVLSDIASSDSNNEAYIKENVTRFVKSLAFKEMHIEAATHYNSGDLDEACDFLSVKSSEINKIDFYEDDIVDMKNYSDMLETSRDRNKSKIPIGIPVIDAYTEGGMPKRSVITVVAGYNIGKTMFMINVAVESAKRGHKVFFTYHEGRKEQIVHRFVSKIAHIKFNKLICSSHILTIDEVNRIEEAKKFIDENIMIKPMRQVGVTVEDVYSYCKEKIKDFKFDLLISDYAQDLDCKKNYNSSYDTQAYVWKTLDQMADELNVAVLTAAQFNREGYKRSKKGNSIVRSDAIGECFSINKISEIIFTLNPHQDGSIVVCLDKQRDGPTGKLVKCQTDMGMATTHDSTLDQIEVTEEQICDGIIDSDSPLLNGGSPLRH